MRHAYAGMRGLDRLHFSRKPAAASDEMQEFPEITAIHEHYKSGGDYDI